LISTSSSVSVNFPACPPDQGYQGREEQKGGNDQDTTGGDCAGCSNHVQTDFVFGKLGNYERDQKRDQCGGDGCQQRKGSVKQK
jgi:hypothetical protein